MMHLKFTSMSAVTSANASAEVSAKEIVALNHGLDPDNIQEKQTILIPAGKLSSRDKEILAGPPLQPKALIVLQPPCPVA